MRDTRLHVSGWQTGFALLGCLLLSGCSGQQQVTNPFTTADRVPAPAQRNVLPGVAQPYYPNDPVPAQPFYPAGASAAAPANTFASTPANVPTNQAAPFAGAVANSGQAIAIPSDDQQLRLTSALPVAVPAQPVTPATFQTPGVAPAANQFATLTTPAPQPSRGPAVQLNPVPSDTVANGQGFKDPPVTTPSETDFFQVGSQSDGLAWNSGSAPRRPVTTAVPATHAGPPVVVASTTPRVRFPSGVSQAAYNGPATGSVQIMELPPQPPTRQPLY